MRNEKLRNSRYAGELKKIIGKDEGIYEEIVKRSKDAMELIVRFILGGETKDCKFWKKEEDKECRICNKEEEGTEHVLSRCEFTGVREESWEEQMKGEKKLIVRLKRFISKREEERKRREMENQHKATEYEGEVT